MKPRSVSVLLLAGGAWIGACGLAPTGAAPPTPDAGGDGNQVAPPDARASDSPASVADASHDTAADEEPMGMDAPGPPDAPPVPDAPAGDGWTCTPFDAGILGPLDLSTFTLAGTAQWNESNDQRITLTNSNNFEAGAAWYPQQMPSLHAYQLTWSFRVGPNDTAGDGITFAVLKTSAAPDSQYVGSDGSGLGLQGLSGTGYAVAVDMYNTNEIRLVTMPGYTTVAAKSNGDTLNDGNVHSVDVSWIAPSTLTATLHSTSGDLTVSSSDPGFAAPAAPWFGFTGATGGGSDSHQEVAGIAFQGVCQ